MTCLRKAKKQQWSKTEKEPYCRADQCWRTGSTTTIRLPYGETLGSDVHVQKNLALSGGSTNSLGACTVYNQ
jgi:hypothetical protein